MNAHIPTSLDPSESSDQPRDSFGPCSGVSFPTTHVISHLALLCCDRDLRKLAMGQFFSRYRDAIYSYFRNLKFDKETAEELVSRFNVKLAGGTLLKTFHPGKRFRAYLKVVLLHIARDYLRKEKKNIGPNDFPATRVRQAEKEFDRKLAHYILANAINELKKREPSSDGSAGPGKVELLILWKFERIPSPELAKRFGLSESQVKSRERKVGINLVQEIRGFFRRGARTEKQIDNEIQALLDSLEPD